MTIYKTQNLKFFRKFIQYLLALGILSFLGSCEEEEKVIMTQDEKDEIILTNYFQENNIQNVQQSSTGLYYIVLEEGTGEQVPNQVAVTTEFKTRILYEKVVQSSEFTGQRVFQTATGQIATGVDEDGNYEYGNSLVMAAEVEAVKEMAVGGKRRLYVPSRLGYPSGTGSNNSTSGLRIPANTVTTVDLEVIKFEL
ncbi:FKBP-type peptidyl-prolyl cis-trans isomerase [Flexithrix dorotheae]|uniref:FKBP-type peptidyl-prolyl cis-trans isomerase n=1 Tax=Flexithrix dorotheae TaxID=70993 RepID=UPI00036E1AC2|nr:FKBP-type peptidyl-prolyl cis-trans isomerase [Flexithrix dorotheae]